MIPSEIVYLPLDLPSPPDLDGMLDWHDQVKVRIVNDITERLGSPWLISQPRTEDGWDEWFAERFPEMVALVGSLRFRSVRMINMLEQVIDVDLHVDISREQDWTLGPSGYRMWVRDDERRSFYIRRGHASQGNLADEEIFPTIPDSTRWWAINNSISSHGAHMPASGRKVILSIWGEVDPEPHLELVRRSAERYADHVIRR